MHVAFIYDSHQGQSVSVKTQTIMSQNTKPLTIDEILINLISFSFQLINRSGLVTDQINN